jgi:hypothetical protein
MAKRCVDRTAWPPLLTGDTAAVGRAITLDVGTLTTIRIDTGAEIVQCLGFLAIWAVVVVSGGGRVVVRFDRTITVRERAIVAGNM